MSIPSRRFMAALLVFGAWGLAAVRTASAAPDRTLDTAGLVFEFLGRTLAWEGEETPSRMTGPALAVRQDIRVDDGLAFSLSAGLALSGFDELVFRGLPISLEYGSGTMPGLVFGAGVRSRFLRIGGVGIGGVGRLTAVYGLAKKWPLEGFAVPGDSVGRLSWAEASVGPYLSYDRSGKFVPTLEISARWLWARLRMDQDLGDLSGTESKKVAADPAAAVSVEGEYRLSGSAALRVRGGVLLRGGATDIEAAAGFHYRF